MLTAEENDLICRVEGEAPMGKLMREFWLPACLSEEVPSNDCDPVRVRLLGEDLVAFRDSDGRVGIVGEFCPHRRASLFFGRNEECGLRCLYHGWKIDVEGTVLEMASEPPESTFKDKIKHTAYPTREAGGFIWVYMGDKSRMPEFEPPLFAPTPETKVSILKVHVKANWAQCLEGAIDSAHSSSLHSTDMPPAMVGSSTATGTAWQRPSTDKAPRLQPEPTDYGFKYAAIRRPIKNSATHDYVRITHFVAPFTVLIPPNNVYNVSQMNAPTDDENSVLYIIAWTESGPGVDQEAWRKFTRMRVGIELDETYRKVDTRENNYGQDRQKMRLGDFTGISGFPHQDIVMWETMGSMANRTEERLGASDVAIVEFRRTMVKAVREFLEGKPAIGTQASRGPRPGLRSFEGVIPKTTDWRDLGKAGSATAAAAE
ncbi:Rieske 2Fe-2S domain-containing protein [Rhizobium sp. WYJ-E13]|uniref:Rieske 2Fe-2S domain-containing protein n=1 Tax=Rhizobium sp. WYJ-E13 TaxID=2849093 RepID=UPI001C1ED6F8|nr:Rieske 2Fe-2S domain-containing protein [Rhizobium sp. WYJ-E13]QWW72382.1 Rieske 2Fe-2S domain-containing protein [Rhizobium sp. WYJ-E13]